MSFIEDNSSYTRRSYQRSSTLGEKDSPICNRVTIYLRERVPSKLRGLDKFYVFWKYSTRNNNVWKVVSARAKKESYCDLTRPNFLKMWWPPITIWNKLWLLSKRKLIPRKSRFRSFYSDRKMITCMCDTYIRLQLVPDPAKPKVAMKNNFPRRKKGFVDSRLPIISFPEWMRMCMLKARSEEFRSTEV